MKIISVNYGFATNSSSSHSIILDKDNKRTGKDYQFYDEDGLMYPEFGRNYFKLETIEAKLMYYAVQLIHSFKETKMKDELLYILINGIINDKEHFNINLIDNEFDEELYVDHQSQWRLPTNLPLGFYKELKDFILQPDIVIIGGNDEESPLDYDNNDYSNLQYYLDMKNIIVPFFKDIKNSSTYYLHDLFYRIDQDNYNYRHDGNFWIFFDKVNGVKKRITFNTELSIKDYNKSTYPELIDLHITDRCNKGCDFCYQNSTVNGLDANKEEITTILYALSQMNVFEVALGGGEPTLHPNFKEIIDYANWHNIVPNFSTYSTLWLKDKEIVDVVKEYVKGIGVSIHNSNDIKIIEEIANVVNENCENKYVTSIYSQDKGPNIIAQHAFNTLPFEDFMKMYKELYEKEIPVLLLGFKNTGRANKSMFITYTKEQLDEFINYLKDNYIDSGSLSVDTLFASTYKWMLDKLEIEENVYEINEGQFSCYIDAVNKKISASSFAKKRYDFEEIEKDDDGYFNYLDHERIINTITKHFPFSIEN
jgi:MoaA/NifB/PqqE/SkfB family radical SAM enzyme